jgi:hypothetical protein
MRLRFPQVNECKLRRRFRPPLRPACFDADRGGIKERRERFNLRELMMKRHLAALMAAGALVMAVPTAASAQERGYFGQGRYYGGHYDGADWNRDNRGYYNLRRQVQHAYDGVRHGLRDGSFTRREARYFYQVIGDLRERLDYYRDTDGYLDRREARDLDRRLRRLHAAMHEAHEDGHDEQGYRYRDSDDYRDGRDDYHHGRDDR